MKYYIVVIDCNNGYSCGCCRQEWTVVEEDCTRNDVLNFINQYKNDDEADIVAIYEVVKEFNTSNFEKETEVK